MIFYWIFMYIFIFVADCCSGKNASVTYDQQTGKFLIHDFIANNSVSYGTYVDEIFVTGWSYLEVKTSDLFPDPIQAYSAGLVEGFLTSDLLKKHWNNLASDYCNETEVYCQSLSSFLQKNLKFLNENIKLRRHNDSYWHQVALTLEQLHGLEDGYKNITSKPSTEVDVLGLLLLNIRGDLGDIEAVLKKNNSKKVLTGASCSALVKVLPNNRELYVAHDTWSGYNTMLRILKKYIFNFHATMNKDSPVIPGHTCTFSSYPGLIFSLDDFYLISSGLVTLETTIKNRNESLYKLITPEGIVLEWQRNIIANRLAEDGKKWTKIFEKMNSGTYNNHWMIVDYKKFLPGKPLEDGLLWVLEQLPGYIHSKDVTKILKEERYWASYNIPYFSDIYNLSGSYINQLKYGDSVSYEKAPRALIFRRDQGKVSDVSSMTKLMRYNDYKNDPLSRCNCTPPYSAQNAISARCDLNPANGTYPYAALGHRQHGGLDMKLTTFDLFKNLEFVAIGGPTYDPLPPFQWSKSDFDKEVKHEGHPDLWKFKPIIHKWIN
ncbi:putative phospholipase B-like 2 isoform X2 [Stegodyphus dumicola]|nr:putative phospholipase B-like 2 isoform X2 [Stegodyphus dumicola]XP_035209141.1 putative phospholipase B-like 2 isoform X2 [Stegodyphus dumicola]